MNKLQPYLDNGKLVVKSGQSSYTETAIQSWDSSKAQSRMDNLLSGYYADSHLDAVLVAADCLALGVISSLESMGYGTDANPYPIVTGQDVYKRQDRARASTARRGSKSCARDSAGAYARSA